MAKLSFRIEAEWEKVQKLREEIERLKRSIGNTDAVQNPVAFNNLNSKLQQTSKELNSVTGNIAQASATMETDFRKRIYAASQGVNDFTEKIIAQKAVVKDVAADVKKLGDAYRDAKKYSPMSADGKLAEWKAAKRALEEEKAALFGLTQEQATARLSVKKLNDEYKAFRQEGGGTAQTMDLLTSKMKGIAATVMGGMGLKELASRIISVRAEFESMETSLKVLLGGNEEKLNNIMGQIKEYALASPLNTKDMVGAVQMMTSFGIEAEKSIDYLKAIGDISMGDTGKFNSLALAFSQMSSAGKLMGQDLMQMVNAGFNPLEEIARKTGKSIGELKEEMSKGAITSKMVQNAFISATSAGGKFFGMSSEGAKTLNGQISMLGESFDMMFNEIGSKGEGVIMDAVKTGTFLVDNYEQVGKVIVGLVETYGAYRVGLALSTLAQNGHTLAMTLARAQILLTEKAQALLNATMLANPYVLAATALGALVGVMIISADTTTAAEDALERYNGKVKENADKVKDEKEEIDKLISTLEDETSSIESKNIAFSTLITKYPTIFGKYKTEKELIDNLTEARRRENAEIERKAELLNQKTYKESKTRAEELNRFAYLQKHGIVRTEEYKRLNDKYHAEVMKNTNSISHFTFQSSLNDLASSATEEYKLNINENRKRQVGKYNASIPNMSKAQAQRELVKLRSDLKKMNKSGKNYLKIGNSEPLSRVQIKERITLLENNVKTERKTMAQWRRGAEKETRKNRKAAKDLASSTELLTKDQAEKRMKAANDALATSEKSAKNFDIQDKSGAKAKADEAKTNSRPHKIPNQNNIDDDALRAAEEAARKREEVFTRSIASQEKIDSERLKAAEAAEEERIAKITNDGERERAEYQLQYDKTIRQLQKQAADMKKAKYEENKKEWELQNTDKTKVYSDTEEGKKGYREIELSQDEENYIQSSIRKADIEYSNQKKKWAEVQKNALTSYLKEYGTFEEKKLAITQEYEEKIRKAGSVGEKATLEMQRDKEIEKAKNDNLQNTIDWNGIFSDLQGHTKQYLQGLRNQLQELLKTGNLPIDQMQTVSEKINAIDDELGKQQGIWDFVGQRTREHNRLLKEAADAQERLNKARNDEAGEAFKVNTIKQDVQKELSKKGLEYDIKDISTASLNGKIDLTDKKFSGMVPLLQKLAVAEGRLTEARKKTIDATNKAKQAEDGAKEKEADKVARWFSDKQDFIKSKGIDQIPDLLESVGLGSASEKAQNGLDAFNNAAGAAEDFASGNFVGAALKGLSAIKSFASVVGIGGDSDPHLEEDIERLTSSNEALKNSIDSLSEEMKKGAVANAYDIYEEQKKHLAQSEKNTQEMMERSAGAYKSGFGGKHSSAAAIDRGLRGTDYWQQISRLLGKNITNAGNFFNLSSEEMAKVAKDLPEIYAQIKLLAKAGYKDAAQFMDDYIGYYKQLEELGSQVEEKLTSSSFDSIVGDFENALMDMDSDMETFADNFENYMRKAVIGALVSNQYKPMIEQWYKAFANFMETDKKLTPDEIKKLKEQGGSYIDKETGKEVKFSSWNDIVSSGLNTKNALLDQLGLGSANQSQKATINEERNLSEDTGSQIVGRLTAIQIAVESGNNKRDNANERLSLMNMKLEDFKSIQVQSNNIADETRTILANSYLELKSINNNTGKSAIHLQEIQGDIKDLKKIMDDKL